VGVRVTDQTGLTFDKSFTLNVTDVNEAPTGASLTGGSVAENAVNGTVVGTVAGVDPDTGATLAYALTDNAGGRFAINANTGQMTVANGALLDYETAASHGVTVRVTDQGGLTFDKSFTIAVTDVSESVNHAPTDATLTGGSIGENAPNGTVVGTVAGVDPDAGATLTYALTDNAGGRFAINATTGQITVADGALLNYESAASHNVTVRVTDQGGLTFDKSFTLNVTDVNEAPTSATLTGGSVAENAANGTVVGTVAGVDADAGATLSYTLIDNADGRFAINATTGQITVADGALLNYESAASHNVTVRVTDQGGLTFDKSFTLNVTDVNEAPTSAALTGGSVAENAADGTAVGSVAGLDADAGAALTYALTDNAGGRFAINATTGVITVAVGALLNYEAAAAHNVTVRVTDQGGLTFDQSFTLNVTNVNEAPTNATLTGGSVAENAATGTVVGSVAGVDPDAGATLTYALTDNADGRFAIDATTGQITVADGALLNYESVASHNVTVRVTDQGGLTFDKSFTLNVTNVNEAPTGATLTGGSVAENAANGAVVGTVAGGDPDAGAVLTYSLTDDAGGRFAINATTGQITVANGTLVDYETATSHAITVHVVDQGGLAFDKVFTIAVTDVNETVNQAPTDATLSGGSIAENASNGAVVGTVTGVDPDSGAVLTYSLTDNAGGRFAINATSGQITVANGALLDYETATSHNVTVRVTDQGGLTFDKVFALNVTNVGGGTQNGTSAANTLMGTAEEDVLNGLGGNDTLNGLGGNDTLDGGAGNDTMNGGAGDDVYIVDAAGDVVNENANEGVDEVRTSLSSYTLGANVENVTATTSTALTASGNDLNNIIKGNSGNDVLFGEDGNDTLLGGAGDDVLQGGEGNDIFDGQGGQNWITTGNGQDTLIFNSASGYLQVDDFSDGNDKIDMRGTGITLQNAAQNITLTEYAEGGVLVEFGTSQIWFENVMPGQITFDGDFIFDTAGGGDNHAPTNATLSGGSVAENSTNGTVVGTVTGVDPDAGTVLSYSLTDNAGGRFAINATTGQITVANGTLLDYETATSHDVSVHIVDQGGLSFDKVFTLAVTDVAGVTQNGTSAANTLTGTNEADTLNGLGDNDTLNGLGGNDVLDGGTGNDTLNGGTGNDLYIVDSSDDVVTENANEGVDEVQTSLSSYNLGNNVENLTGTNTGGFTGAGNALNNIITGNSGNDVLFGEDGNDILRGGTGDDVMQGGEGNDTFEGQGGTKWITTGDGADTLVFNAASGGFQVDDFTDGSDMIDMRGTGVTLENAAQNITLTEYAEGGVLVQFGSSEIWLEHVMPGHITFANDFIFSN
jgi:Ca2+-binding RTX toxin-like protein